MKKLILTLLVIVLYAMFSPYTSGQRRTTITTPHLEDLPQRPIDTIATADPDTWIVLYSNNTWTYYRPGMNRFDDLPQYRENWDTSQVFSYRSVELTDIAPVTDIKLISSLSEFSPPIVGRVFSKYGRRGRRNHNGVDIPLKTGEPIFATFEGRVRYAKYNTGGFGNLVIIRHKNGLETWYAHLSKRNVVPGEYVKAGQIIGFGGNTGRSRGPHLHFEVRYCDQTFDPEHIIDFENGILKYQTFALEKSYFNINSRASDQLEEHDFEEYAAMANAEGEEITSEDILNHIAKAQTAPSRTATVSASTGDAVYHTVRSGDILGRIAIRYGVSIDQICRLNGINRNTVLQIGRRLRVK